MSFFGEEEDTQRPDARRNGTIAGFFKLHSCCRIRFPELAVMEEDAGVYDEQE